MGARLFERPDAGEQIGFVDRFDNVVAGALAHAPDAVGVLALGGANDYRDAPRCLIARELARGLAPAVRVNGIAPGYVNSNWECSFGDMDAAARESVPLARVGQPEEYAEVIVYLCAGAPYITGEVIQVTGGTRI